MDWVFWRDSKTIFLFKSEQELRITQSEFDRQAEITRLLLEGISSTHVSIHSLKIHLEQDFGSPKAILGGKTELLSHSSRKFKLLLSNISEEIF